MKTNTLNFLVMLLVIIYDLALILGCGYAVFILGRSGWWFLLAIIFMMKSYPQYKDKENTNITEKSDI